MRFSYDDIKPCDELETPSGIFLGYDIKEWRVRKSIFHFKFKLRGEAINFCIKHDIPLENEYFYGIGKVWIGGNF